MPDETLTKKDLELINYQIKELGGKIDSNNIQLSEKIDDLRLNYTSRLDTLDQFQRNADKVFAAKVEQNKVNESLDKRTARLEDWQNKVIGGLVLLNIILGFILIYYKK